MNEPAPLLPPVIATDAGVATPETPSLVEQPAAGTLPNWYVAPLVTPVTPTVGAVLSILTVTTLLEALVFPALSCTVCAAEDTDDPSLLRV